MNDPTSTCRKCQQIVVKKMLKEKVFVDESNRRWKGRVCPNCVMKRHRDYMRKARGSDLSKRSCDHCGIEFVPKRGNQVYCGIPCRRLSRRKK